MQESNPAEAATFWLAYSTAYIARLKINYITKKAAICLYEGSHQRRFVNDFAFDDVEDNDSKDEEDQWPTRTMTLVAVKSRSSCAMQRLIPPAQDASTGTATAQDALIKNNSDGGLNGQIRG